MEEIRIRSKRYPKRWFVFFGAIWTAIGLTGLFIHMDPWMIVIYFLLGLEFFFLPFIKRSYLTIRDGMLTKTSFIPKRIPLNEVHKIRYFAGDYTLMTKKKKLTIDTAVIDQDALEKLKDILNDLNVEWEKPAVR